MLYLTYNMGKLPDGMGAQYQRIIGIIGIANYYNYTYVHNPIIKMDHLTSDDYLGNIEQFFQIINNYSNINSIVYDNIYEEDNPSINTLTNYDNNNKNKNILIKIFFPFNICDAKPIVYEKVMPKLRSLLIDKNLPFYNNDETIKIALHLRRGDVKLNVNSDRYTPIDDIIKIINLLKNKYINCTFYIFTQIDETNKNEFDIFNNDDAIKIKANEDQLLTMNHLIHADVLVMCKSSFSYIAGCYNKNIIYYNPFWHSPLSSWINIQNLYNNIDDTDDTEETKKMNNVEYFYSIVNNDSNDYILFFLIIIIIIYWIIKLS